MDQSKKVELIIGVVVLFAIASIIIYKLTWDLLNVDLYKFYFVKEYLTTSLFSGLFLFVVKNRFVGAILLICCIMFGGISITYLIDCVGNGDPKLNSVYLSFFIGASLALLNILYQWIKQSYTRK